MALDPRVRFGLKLIEIRKTKGWSQERLALECELDRTYVSAVERSRWNVSLSNMERLAQALGVEVWTLLRAPQSQNFA